MFQHPSSSGTPVTNATNIAPPSTSKPFQETFLGSDEVIQTMAEFENRLTRAKNLKDESILDFDLGINEEEMQTEQQLPSPEEQQQP